MKNIKIGDVVFAAVPLFHQVVPTPISGVVTEIRGELLSLDCDKSPASVRLKHVVRVESLAK